MYKIIGGDQKEYGPITADQLRQWFREGRANGQSHILPEGATQWVPLSSLPEFADLFGVAPGGAVIPGAPVAPASPETILDRDYTLDIGDCISRSWTLVKDNFWPVVGVSFLVYLCVGGINQLLGLVTRPAMKEMMEEHRFSPGAILIVVGISILGTPVYTIFTGGLFRYYLKLIRHQEASIGDAFSGFNNFGQLALLGLVSGLLTWLGYIFCVVPGIYLNVAWMFCIPLVVDRQLPFWDAMELSRKVVTKHWFLVFAFFLVVGLLAVCGVIACCVGVFVTAPISLVAMMYAYEDIFGPRPS